MCINRKYRIDYLANHKDYKVCQKEGMYHFNTDTCLLGEFIKINEGEKVLDVGSNNGALLVYVSNKKGIPYGIEINRKAKGTFKRTMKANNIKATLIIGDFIKYRFKERFDVIISNPPYFNSNCEKEKKKNENIKNARHDDMLSLESLAISIANNLNENGRVYLVYNPYRLDELEARFNEAGLFIRNYQYVKTIKKNSLVSVLIELDFKKEPKNKLNDIKI